MCFDWHACVSYSTELCHRTILQAGFPKFRTPPVSASGSLALWPNPTDVTSETPEVPLCTERRQASTAGPKIQFFASCIRVVQKSEPCELACSNVPPPGQPECEVFARAAPALCRPARHCSGMRSPVGMQARQELERTLTDASSAICDREHRPQLAK